MDPRKVVKLAYDSIGPEFGKKRKNTWDFVVDWLEKLKLKQTDGPLKLLIAGCGNGRSCYNRSMSRSWTTVFHYHT